jgi:hypothetical protein
MRWTTRTAVLGAGAILAWTLGLAPGAAKLVDAQAPAPSCTSQSPGAHLVTFANGGFTFNADPASAQDGRYGYYALPSRPPVGIVAVAHGYQQTAYSMADPGEYTDTGLIETLAAKDDVIALAVDNTGQQDGGPGTTSSRGWKVTQGAADLTALTERFDTTCQRVGRSPLVITLFGISMGGDTSGIAAAGRAVRSNGAPLFDYWFDVSGVSDLSETWLEATTYSQVSSYAAQASSDIETELGGTPAQEPEAYAAASPALLAGQMRTSGISGVEVFHAVMDGLVTSDEGVQMVAALQAAGIPVDFFTAVFQEPGASSTTIDGDLLGAVVPGYHSPFAGHVDGIMIDTAMARLQALYASHLVPRGLSVTLADGRLGTIPLAASPVP